MIGYDEEEEFLNLDPYHGAGEHHSYQRRAAEADDLIESMALAMETESCPKCRYDDVIPAAFVYRFYYEGQWFQNRPNGMGHSHLGRELIQRRCPRCDATWYERPADYVRGAQDRKVHY